MSLNFVQGDTAPDIRSVLADEDDPSVVVALDEVTGVRFQMRRSDDRRYTVNAAAEVLDAPSGLVSYSWGANDLAVPGTYLYQWELTWIGGRIQTTDPENPPTLVVRRQ